MMRAVIWLATLGLLTHTAHAATETSYHPNTGAVFIPSVKVVGDASNQAYSVDMQQTGDKTFMVTRVQPTSGAGLNIQLGPRPYFLIEKLPPGPLKSKLQSCSEGPFKKSEFSIGHRGATMQFPEHTRESYLAGARMGAGILECDVTFTKDKELVCRHSQCDLHTTTNILETPLAAKCSQPFTPADPATGKAASAKCCTSDITLAEYKTLKGKMDASNPRATTVQEYLGGTANWRTDLYATSGTLMTHAESIQLFKQLGVKMTPELKSPEVPMPFDGFTQEAYAQKLINEYKAAGVPASSVFPQSFNYTDILYWVSKEPTFGAQAVYLDGRAYGETADDRANFANFNPNNPATWEPRNMANIFAQGVRYIAPPTWVLVTLDANKKIVPSAYALAAKQAGLKIITWTLERSNPLNLGKKQEWYFQSVTDGLKNDGDILTLLDVLAQQVGVTGIFTDWPATVTYYANCMGLK